MPNPSGLLPGCSYSVKTSDCDDNRKTTRLFNYSAQELNESIVWTHKGCACNEAVALSCRHQVDDGKRYNSKLDLWKYLRPMSTKLSPCSEEYIVQRYSGPKRKLLQQAQDSLAYEPVCAEDAKVKMFLKADKYHINKMTAPRCIQYRNKRYCLRLATYLHPIEKRLYSRTDKSDTPVFAKSRNLTQRGADLRTKWESFENPVAILMDHSKFDAHCNEQLLSLEHKFYSSCIRVSDGKKELQKLLNWQLLNKGATKNGTLYSTKATRMSGDQNTGCGNSIINYAMLKAFDEHFELDSCMYIDGDDSVLICEANRVGLVNVDFFSQFGMTTKMELASEFSKVDFCQTRPVFDGVAWRCVRDPNRLLARLPWLVYNLPENCHARYLKSVGMCEMALGVGLPVAQYVGDKLSKLSDKKYMITDLHYVAMKEYQRPCAVKLVQPTRAARESYEEAWGIDIPTQLRWENATIEPPNISDTAAEYFEEDYYLLPQ